MLSRRKKYWSKAAGTISVYKIIEHVNIVELIQH